MTPSRPLPPQDTDGVRVKNLCVLFLMFQTTAEIIREVIKTGNVKRPAITLKKMMLCTKQIILTQFYFLVNGSFQERREIDIFKIFTTGSVINSKQQLAIGTSMKISSNGEKLGHECMKMPLFYDLRKANVMCLIAPSIVHHTYTRKSKKDTRPALLARESC